MKQIIVLLVIAFFAIAGSIEPNLAALMRNSADTDLIPVCIVAHGQVDRNWVNSATMGMDRAERQQFAVNAMMDISIVSQQGILEELKSYNIDNVANVKALWLANTVYCEASVAVIKSLAERSDVVVIERGASDEMGLIEPIDVREPTSEELDKALAWGVSKINADDAWAAGYEGQGVIVGVIDTGVDYNHIDLVSNIWHDTPGGENLGYDFDDGDTDPMDYHGHGTHCAGSVAGNGTGGTQTGVAPEATIMALKINYISGGYPTWIEAMQFATARGVQVLTMSLGTSPVGNTTLRTAEENLLTAGVYHSVAAANSGPGAGTILASGDCPPPWFHPDQVHHGGQSAVVTVGATDSNDNIADFSSRGPVTWWSDYSSSTQLIDPDISGPGVNILSTARTGGYTTMSGTSMATPHLAGVAALILSANSSLTVAQMDSIIEMTSLDLGSSGKDNTYGAGRVDAYQACLAAASMTSTEESQSAVIPTSVSLSAISPNPVTSFAAFSVYTDVTAVADISVFDVSGRRIANIETAEITSGANAYNWQIPAEMGSGIYFVRATINGTTASSRMTVLR